MSFKIPDVFLIKYGTIDDEHKNLVAHANTLLQISENGSANNFEHAFQALIDEFKIHFRNEEALMADTAYDGLNWHAKHHQESLGELETLYTACQAKGKVDPTDIYACFDQVIKDVAKADLKFSEFLDSTGGRETSGF